MISATRCRAAARSRLILAGAVIALVIFISGENAVIPSFQKCISQEAAAQGQNNAQKERFVIGRFIGRETVCTARLLDSHSGLIGALAGLAVAGFTATLWLSTKRLWLEAERQRTDAWRAHEASVAVAMQAVEAAEAANALSRDNFTVNVRPWISIVSWEALDRIFYDQDGCFVGLRLTIKNIGRSPATNILLRAKLFPRLLQTNLGDEQRKLTDTPFFQVFGPDDVLFPDQTRELTFSGRISREDVRVEPGINETLITPVILGSIVYRFAIGPDDVRRTNFALIAGIGQVPEGASPGPIMFYADTPGCLLVAKENVGFIRYNSGWSAD